MRRLIGREYEINRLDRVMAEEEAQLVIVYGRRRVGKTYLISEYFENKFDFVFTGAYDKTTDEQLKNFGTELSRAARKKIDKPTDWTEAFYYLRDYIEAGNIENKQVIFFDEMPWMDRQRSGFLSAFEWFWNSWGCRRDNLVFIVCGSAASWMTEKLDSNKGGLFNRQTCRLYLKPFTLREAELYLNSRDIYWSRYDITQCYMIMGGIPYYLKLLDNRLTMNENIDNIFFKEKAELWDEFEHLYNTLFSNSEQYIKIVEQLSRKISGLTREEMIKAAGVEGNGNLTKILSNLENSGFIRVNRLFGRKKRENIYQLCDYYSAFYFRFIKDNYGREENLWSNMVDNPSRNSWAGLTFEQVCRDHIGQIKKKLGISGVMTEISLWRKIGNDYEKGTQIDMIIDRRDMTMNICEIKFSTHEYEIDKDYDMSLKNKVEVFRGTTGTKKTLLPTMITTYGIKRNKYSNYVSKEVCMDDLFE
ncbi:MAG: AAA family ATPase [Lachnospiraceae bacterium]|nr:AAA family ATPase [Lachnospiraceae bacterium]